MKCFPSLPPQRFLKREQEALAEHFLPESGTRHGKMVVYLLGTFKKMAKWIVYVDPSSVPFVPTRPLKGGPQLCCPQASKEEILVYMVWVHLKAGLQSGVGISGTNP